MQPIELHLDRHEEKMDWQERLITLFLYICKHYESKLRAMRNG